MTRLIVMLDTRSRGGFATFVTPLPETVAPAQNACGQPQETRIATAQLPHAANSPDAKEVADAAVATWAAVHAALAPVVGARGVAALYKRTLFLASETYPWLAAAFATAAEPGDLTSLRVALSQQDGGEAAAAQQQLLQALHQLLDQLIGPVLTGRLLHTVWASLSSAGSAVRDDSP